MEVTVNRMVGPTALVRLKKKDRDWIGILVSIEGYREQWDYEVAEVLAVGESIRFAVSEGDTVLVRARSGGVAGTDVSRDLGGEGLVIVHYDEMIAVVVDRSGA